MRKTGWADEDYLLKVGVESILVTVLLLDLEVGHRHLDDCCCGVLCSFGRIRWAGCLLVTPQSLAESTSDLGRMRL